MRSRWRPDTFISRIQGIFSCWDCYRTCNATRNAIITISFSVEFEYLFWNPWHIKTLSLKYKRRPENIERRLALTSSYNTCVNVSSDDFYRKTGTNSRCICLNILACFVVSQGREVIHGQDWFLQGQSDNRTHVGVKEEGKYWRCLTRIRSCHFLLITSVHYWSIDCRERWHLDRQVGNYLASLEVRSIRWTSSIRI
jgi:hypothetical protein